MVNSQDVLCLHDYSERLVTSFEHQIKSEYYCGNHSVSIEGIALEHLCEVKHTGDCFFTKLPTIHAVFH